MMFFRPADVILAKLGIWNPKMPSMFLIYDHFARLLCQWDKPGNRKQVLNDTSSINNTSFRDLTSMEAPRDCVANMLAHVGQDNSYHAAEFLRWCGLKKWSDLAKPIALPFRDPDIKGSWFELGGRTFNYSPNDCHPKAKTVQYGAMHFESWNLRWSLKLYFSYPHDSSSWHVSHEQNSGQSLAGFTKSIEPWIERQLESEPWAHKRHDDERDWARIYRGVRDVFHLDVGNLEFDESRIADLLAKVGGTSMTCGRIKLDEDRLATVRRWIQSDARKAAKSKKVQG